MLKNNVKTICALALVLVMLLSSTIVFAAEGDHFDQEGQLVYTANRVRADVKARNHARAIPSFFQMEVKGKLYSLTNVVKAFNEDMDNWKDIITAV